jgi:uncharacterized protein (DUF1697 family)
MPRFVVLLRGVNVGKGHRIPMADFRSLLEALGFTRVQTVLNSGNAVLDSEGRSAAAHASRIALALRERLGLDVAVVVKSARDFLGAVAQNPLASAVGEHSRFLVAFAQVAASLRDLSVLQSLVQPPEQFSVGPQAAYLHCAGGILQSKVATALLGKAGRAVTTRNLATVTRLAGLLRQEA